MRSSILVLAIALSACGPRQISAPDVQKFKNECIASGGTFSAITNRDGRTINNMKCHIYMSGNITFRAQKGQA